MRRDKRIETVEQAANRELLSNYAACDKGAFRYDSNAMKNMFRKGAEWYERQLSLIPDMNDTPGRKRRNMKFCDYCVHFKPKEDFSDTLDNFDFSELCKFKKKLRFKMPPSEDYMSRDYGFYHAGCKDYKQNN